MIDNARFEMGVDIVHANQVDDYYDFVDGIRVSGWHRRRCGVRVTIRR